MTRAMCMALKRANESQEAARHQGFARCDTQVRWAASGLQMGRPADTLDVIRRVWAPSGPPRLQNECAGEELADGFDSRPPPLTSGFWHALLTPGRPCT